MLFFLTLGVSSLLLNTLNNSKSLVSSMYQHAWCSFWTLIISPVIANSYAYLMIIIITIIYHVIYLTCGVHFTVARRQHLQQSVAP